MKKSLFCLRLMAALGSAVVTVSPLLATSVVAEISQSKAVVDLAKAKGLVGEGNDGYIGVVSGTPDAKTLSAMAEINAGRRDVYAQAAAKNGVSIEAAAGSAFTNSILPRVKTGEFYQDATGRWVRK